MVTLAQALQWRPESLTQFGRGLRAEATALLSASGELDGALAELDRFSFSGINREEAQHQAAVHAAGLRRGALALQQVADACQQAADGLTPAVAQLRENVEVVTAFGFQVNPDTGSVALGPPAFSPGDQWLMNVLAQCEQQITQALEAIRSIDEATGSAVAAIVPLGLAASESDAQVDGEGAGGSGELRGSGGSADAGTAGTAGPQLSEDVVARARELGLPGGTLLESSPEHSAIAFGDVTSAKTVITLVPGTGSSADRAHEQLDRVAAMFKASGEPPSDVAVVLFSYDAPNGLTEAAKANYHDAAAERLQHLQSELGGGGSSGASGGGSSSGGPQRHVVAGYSYGSTVVAQSTRSSGLVADRVLLIASPGVGPGLQRADDMKLLRPDGTAYEAHEKSHRVAVATSPADPIQLAALAGVHGPDPKEEDFGAHQLNLDRPWWEAPRTLAEAVGTRDPKVLWESHSTHYFDDEIFTRETRQWLQRAD